MKLLLVVPLASAQQLCSGGVSQCNIAWTRITTNGLINDDKTGWTTGAPAGWNGHSYHSRGRNGVSAGHYSTIDQSCGNSLNDCFGCANSWNGGVKGSWGLCDGGSTSCQVGIVNYKSGDCRIAGQYSSNSPGQTTVSGWEGWAAGSGSGSGSATQLCDDLSSPCNLMWTRQSTNRLIRDDSNTHTAKRSGTWNHAHYDNLSLSCGNSLQACMSCCENDSACQLVNFCSNCATGAGGTTKGGGDCRLAGNYSPGQEQTPGTGWEGWSYSASATMETESDMETDTDKMVSSLLDEALDTAL